MSDEENGGPGGSYVTKGWIGIIAAYLLLLTILTFVGIVWQWPVCDLTCKDNTGASTAGNVPDAGSNANNSNAGGNTNNSNAGAPNANNSNAGAPPAPAQQQPPAGGANQGGADVDSIAPTSGSINGNTQVTVKGKGFEKGDSVRFDGIGAKVVRVTADSISVRTPCHEEGVVDVTVHRANQEQDVLANSYTYTCPAPEGRRLFLMIILAGALGGILHSIRSLWWYVGHRDLKWSWVLMYVFLPFGGAAMAMVFYLIIIAGFLPTSPGNNIALFVIAVAALVGMFSQQAALKLTDIANAFFTKPGQGSDAKPQKSLPVGATDTAGTTALTTTAMNRETGKVTGGDDVTITGTGFSTPVTVKFGDQPATVKTDSVTATSLTVVTPEHTAGPVDVVVTCGNQTSKLPKQFNYA